MRSGVRFIFPIQLLVSPRKRRYRSTCGRRNIEQDVDLSRMPHHIEDHVYQLFGTCSICSAYSCSAAPSWACKVPGLICVLPAPQQCQLHPL